MNIFTLKTFFNLIVKFLNDEDNFPKLLNEFHYEAPLFVIEDCFLLVLAIIAKILLIFFT